MQEHNLSMREALSNDDFQRYYSHNVAFHDCPLELSGNTELKRLITTHRQRLYDFPRRDGFVKDWELRSVEEHKKYVDLLLAGKCAQAASFIRDVHWSFAVQESFIRRYYAAEIDRA